VLEVKLGQVAMAQSSVQDLPVPLEMPGPVAPSNAAIAWTDIWEGFQKNWFWGALAMQDVKLRYRGSMIGPFWMTLSMAIMVAAMGVIYAKLFNQDPATYLPFLTTGIITWTFISGQINEGCQTFLAAQSLIQTVPLPFSVHAYRLVARNLIMLAHNLVILPPVLIFFHVPLTWRMFETVPALLLLSLNSVWVCIFFGIISARFRDVPPIVQNFVQVIFFVTPIFWTPTSLGRWQVLFELNPLFAAIDIVRAPIMGRATAPYSWALMLGVTVIGCSVTFMLFSRFHSRIAYWV
jgi:ABC-type polysaccharide/polyol phosphate export permease